MHEWLAFVRLIYRGLFQKLSQLRREHAAENNRAGWYQSQCTRLPISELKYDKFSLVDEVARTCNNLDQLVSTLEDHRLKQMAELEADLAARQEKIMGTWVESFTAMNKAKDNGRLNEYTSQLVLLVNSFLNKNEFRQAKLWTLLTFFFSF